MAELMRNSTHPRTLNDLCFKIIQGHPEFPSKSFLKETTDQLGNKGLSERLELITQGLNKHPPSDFSQPAKVTINSWGDKLNHLADDLKEITTRQHCSGLYKVEIQINGEIFAEKEFQLQV